MIKQRAHINEFKPNPCMLKINTYKKIFQVQAHTLL